MVAVLGSILCVYCGCARLLRMRWTLLNRRAVRGIALALYISLSLSFSLSFSPSLAFSLSLSFSLSLFLSFSLSISLFLSLSLYLSLSFFLSLSLSLSRFLSLSLSQHLVVAGAVRLDLAAAHRARVLLGEPRHEARAVEGVPARHPHHHRALLELVLAHGAPVVARLPKVDTSVILSPLWTP